VVNAGFVLMAASAFRALGPRLWRLPTSAAWALAGLAIAAFGLCWWARLHLGRTWSWGVTLKQSHPIVETGPYGVVRHPIYTGVIVAAAATALIEAKAAALAGLALMVARLSIKARLEERFLTAELGAAAYGAYAARTGMLLPKLRLGTASAAPIAPLRVSARCAVWRRGIG
jgi:protein-S-isoprenylcysteine O-methyltransferase Ste14